MKREGRGSQAGTHGTIAGGGSDESHAAAIEIIATALRSVARPTYTDTELMGFVERICKVNTWNGYAPAIAVLREMLEGKG